MTTISHGDRRRQDILSTAADLSTTQGLSSLSFAQVAEGVGLTKAGVAAHFRSKEALQLAVVEQVAVEYQAPLTAAAADSAPGVMRLAAIAGAWFNYLAQIDYAGGCFFAAAGQAFAGKPGPVRDLIARHTQSLLSELEEQAQLAQRLGELGTDVDPKLLVFQIHALTQEANLRRELLGDAAAFVRAQQGLVATFTTAVVPEFLPNILSNLEVYHESA